MSEFLAFTVVGLVSGCIYALTATGLVVTYITSGVFNFAHGAIGMIAAFAYWELAVNRHWPTWLAFIVVLFGVAPLMGAIIERVLMRRLRGAPVGISLVVTVGLLLFLLGLATVLWDPSQARVVPLFWAGHFVRVFGINLSYHQLTVMVAAAAVAIGLRLFLYRTRPGTAMRAVVDNPDLVAMTGASPARFGQLGWMLGAMMASLAGILVVPLAVLDPTILTLLVINGFAAAMIGRLRSLPITFVGGLVLGLADAYVTGYLPPGQLQTQIKPVVPMIILVIVLLALPQTRIETGRLTTLRTPRVAGMKESLAAGAALIAVGWILSTQLSLSNLLTLGHGMALAVIMLSLVILTGYGGQVSLCQMTFVGIAAFTMGKVGGSGGSFVGVLAAVGISAAVGALVALPALRLRGLYLALITLAFADAMDSIFFQNNSVFGAGGSVQVGRVHIPGIPTQSDQAFFMVLVVVFAVAAVAVLALRRSAFGRRLAAMSDSPAACATLGINLTWTKLIVFTISAGLAGLGGVLYGGQQSQVGASDFTVLLSMVLLLLATIWGLKTVSGVLIAGLVFAEFPVLQQHLPEVFRNLTYLLTGLGAISLGRNPNGIMGSLSLWPKLRARRGAPPGEEAEEGAAAIERQEVGQHARIAG